MRSLILGAFALIGASATAAAQTNLSPFTPEPYDWSRYVMVGYYGSPDCTRDRERATAQRAIEVCSRFIETNARPPEIAGALLVRGDRYQELDDVASANADYERALELYTEEVEEAPRTPGPLTARSDALYDLNRFEEALADVNQAILIDSGFALAHYRRADIHFRLGNYTAAIADYDRTARLGERMAERNTMFGTSPNDRARLNPAITARRCEARAAAGVELDAARNFCRNAMRGSREHFAFSRGFLRFKQGDFAGAWEDFNTTAEDDEHNGYALYGRGVAAIRLGRQAEGEADIARGQDLEGDELEAYANAGLRP